MSNDINPEVTETIGANNLSHPVVLLVDDQAIVAEAIRRMLADEADIEFHYCKEPASAVGKANEIRPTIILQDLVMPEVDGYTLLKFYRGNPATSGTPVIVLSSREDPKDKRQAFENGASDYLVKLPDKIELIARIRAHSNTYLLQLQRDEAYREMKKLQEQLTESHRKLEESNATLLRLSTMDGLTGIANRRHFDETLMLEWKAGLRGVTALSMIMLDIDFFKKYNDGYGHQGGDDCLKEVAKTLRDSLRRPGDFIARYGGEEFVAILPGTDAKGAAMIAEQMRADIATRNIPHAYSNVTDHVSISLGVATMRPDKTASPADLVAKADGALYKAKEQGRNCYVVAE